MRRIGRRLTSSGFNGRPSSSKSRVTTTSRAACRGYNTTPCGVHPLIDVIPLLDGGSCSTTASHIGAALREVGWFYAAGASVLPPEYICQIYAYLARAHALPASVKHVYRQRGGLGSYSGPDVGEPELNYDAGATDATVRGWDYSRSRFSLGAGAAVPPAERYPPAEVLSPPFSVVLDELYERQDTLGRALLRGVEAALAMPADSLLGQFEGGDFGTVRLLHYPALVDGDPTRAGTSSIDAHGAQPSADVGDTLGYGIGAHTDFEVFTLMHQDAPGLQFLRRAPGGVGHVPEWVDAPVRPCVYIYIYIYIYIN